MDVPDLYTWVGIGTTVVSVDEGGVHGPGGDLAGSAALGAYLNDTVSVELMVGATVFVDGAYGGVGFGPSIVWAFHPNAYVAMREYTLVHPEVSLSLIPSAGVTALFGDLAPYVELGLAVTPRNTGATAGLSPSAGVTVLF